MNLFKLSLENERSYAMSYSACSRGPIFSYAIAHFAIVAFSTLPANAEEESPPDLRIIAPESGVYLGAFTDFGGTEDEVSKVAIREFLETTQKGLAWAYFSNNWTDKVEFPETHARIITDEGIVPFIRLMPRQDFDKGCDNPNPYSLVNINSGELDRDLEAWAQAAKKFGQPLMVEFGTETNGDWFPWSGLCNGGGKVGPRRFRRAYRHIVQIFRTQHVNNVTWVFHVDAYDSPNVPWNRISEYYPGDEWVDWIGVSAYGPQTAAGVWQEFSEVIQDVYWRLTALSDEKPIAVLEWGVHEPHEGGDKSVWITSALQAVKDGRYPRIKGISYWHENFGDDQNKSTSRLRVDSSPESEDAYRIGISSDFFVTTVQLKE